LTQDTLVKRKKKRRIPKIKGKEMVEPRKLNIHDSQGHGGTLKKKMGVSVVILGSYGGI